MAIVNSSRTLRGTTQTFYTDDTAPRILAFLASVQCLFDEDQVYEGFRRGRSLIERIAMRTEGTDSPRICLSNEECADVLHFLAQVEPRDKRNCGSTRNMRPVT
jgi:hypothetical protein